MITHNEALENPELMIKYKDDLKDVEIFEYPWYGIFRIHPHLYREFSDRFDEMTRAGIYIALRDDPTLVSDLKDYLHKLTGANISCALIHNPTLILDLKDYLHKMDGWDVGWVLRCHPEMSLYLKYKDDPDKLEAAYYIAFPHKLDDLNKEEKREISKKIIEFLGKEKI